MFDELRSKISGNLDCAAICLYLEYDNEIRKKFVESGLNIGFKNVEIIYWKTAVYLSAMAQINFKPLNGDVIWIYTCICIYVWNIDEEKAKFVGEWNVAFPKSGDIQYIFNESKLNKGPNVVLYEYKINEAIFGTISTCRFFSYKCNAYFYSSGSLVKARITAGDSDLMHLDTASFLSQDIALKIKDTNIARFINGQKLPLLYCQKLTNNSYDDALVIEMSVSGNVTYKLPNFAEYCFTFKIDANEIYSVTAKAKRDENNLCQDENEEIELLTITECFVIPTVLNPGNTKINAIGIDLGTTRCCAAVNRKTGMTCIPLDNTGERLLPSYVAYDEKNVKCGKVVVNRLRNNSKATIFDSKRIIGRSLNDIEIDSFWPFNLVQENNKMFLEIDGFNGKCKITAEEVASDLLKFIKQKSEEYQGTQITKAVITVPAAFTESQKKATMAAASLAGWKEIKLLPEPIAAVFAYSIKQQFLNNSTVLLFDLGGGTLDVCICKIYFNIIEIITNIGDSNIGGRNFDTVLANYFKTILKTKFNILELKNRKYKLMLECQTIKEELSSMNNSSLNVDEYDPSKDEQISISREEFENMAKPMLNKIQNTIHSALFKSKLKENQINKVLSVGGGSRMPMIKKLLENIFSSAEQCCEEHPDEVVAIGAAYYAYNIFSEL